MSGVEVFDALLTGLTSVLAWPAIGFMVLGVAIGMWMGAVPGPVSYTHSPSPRDATLSRMPSSA